MFFNIVLIEQTKTWMDLKMNSHSRIRYEFFAGAVPIKLTVHVPSVNFDGTLAS